MPQISRREFEQLPLRVHDFMQGVPLHDAWAVDLPKPRSGITLDAFLRRSDAEECEPPLAARTLLRFRFFLGRLFGWERTPRNGAPASFTDRLTSEDRARTLEVPGAKQGFFRVVYRFQNEQLAEVLNATVHGAALSALVENTESYRYYFAVYVRSVGPLTPIYMALIDPVRKLVVYPSLLRGVRADWVRLWR